MQAGAVALENHPLALGSLIGTRGELLMTIGLPSAWVWQRVRVLISHSNIRKNFSASMTCPVLNSCDRILRANRPN
jgi:hypothetical protein